MKYNKFLVMMSKTFIMFLVLVVTCTYSISDEVMLSEGGLYVFPLVLLFNMALYIVLFSKEGEENENK